MDDARQSELVVYADQVPTVRPNGITSVRLTPDPVDGQCFRMGITSFEPGASVPFHTHSTVEQVCVIEGTGVVTMNGVEHTVGPYDTTRIPPGQVHCFRNTGESTMRILYVYGSTDVWRTWTETGESVEQFPAVET